MQVGAVRQPYESAAHCRNVTWKNEGIVGFIKGSIATVLLILATSYLEKSWSAVEVKADFLSSFNTAGRLRQRRQDTRKLLPGSV